MKERSKFLVSRVYFQHDEMYNIFKMRLIIIVYNTIQQIIMKYLSSFFL